MHHKLREFDVLKTERLNINNTISFIIHFNLIKSGNRSELLIRQLGQKNTNYVHTYEIIMIV